MRPVLTWRIINSNFLWDAGPMSDGISPTDWPSNRSVDDRRAEIDATITLWVGNQRLDAALKAAELGALSFLQKEVVMRNGLLISCIKHCRMNPRAEAKIPILIMIMFLADNNAGICYLGVMRMARSPSAPRHASSTTSPPWRLMA